MICLNWLKTQRLPIYLSWRRLFPITSRQRYQNQKSEEKSDLRFVRTPDILEWLGEHKQSHQTLIGFAMETDNVIENASKKLERKNADYICVNQLNESNKGFGADKNTITLLGIDKTQKTFSGLKSEIASEILHAIF